MKKTLIAPLLAVIGCAAVVATLALGGGPKLNAVFEAKATSKSFTFNAATGSQFASEAVAQEVDVTTGVSSPIHAKVTPTDIGSLAFGQGGRFVEAHPNKSEDASYSLTIGINNLTHFEIDMGVTKDDEVYEDVYNVELHDEHGEIRKYWYYDFEPDGDGNGTKHIEWDKNPSATYKVVEVLIELYFDVEDSADTNLYIESLSLTWDC